MKPKDALDLLEQMVAQVNASGQMHAQLRQALDCLRTLIDNLDQAREDE